MKLIYEKKENTNNQDTPPITIQEALALIKRHFTDTETKAHQITFILMEIILKTLAKRDTPIRRFVLIDELNELNAPFPHDLGGTLKRIIKMMIGAGIIAKETRGRKTYYRLIPNIIIGVSHPKGDEADSFEDQCTRLAKFREFLFALLCKLHLFPHDLDRCACCFQKNALSDF